MTPEPYDEVDVELLNETDQAWLVALDRDKEEGVWVPKSICDFEPSSHNPLTGTLSAPVWLLEEKGLV